jgi:Fic-DOC domain mobile mystery protein B
MTDAFHVDDDATPLTPEERDALIPTHITLRGELNELEQNNIAEVDRWAFERKRNVLGEDFLKGLHRRMFNKVWKWAGEYRKTEKNIGINPPFRIQPEMWQTIEDTKFWIENKSYPPDEIAVRFHHRLVSVHPFPNGNGRWSRLAADLLIVQQAGARFTWGRTNLQAKGDIRRAYINALKAADNHDLEPLIKFARS